MTLSSVMAVPDFYEQQAKSGRPVVQVSFWRGYATGVFNLFTEQGYRVAHITTRMEGDKPHTEDTTYDVVFTK